MKRNCCHISLGFLLKFLNFLQGFIGVSILLYSIWMLDQWNNHIPSPRYPPPSPPSPGISPDVLQIDAVGIIDYGFNSLKLVSDVVTRFDEHSGFGFLNSIKLPAPWFIYSFMGVGILICCITFVGCIAAEVINGCCLCFYALLKTVLLILEAALIAFIAVDRHWEKDLPFDPTEELDSLRSFIEDNVDICKWVGMIVLVIQVLSLFLAIVLRSMVSPQSSDSDCEDDYESGRNKLREPLLHPRSGQASSSTASAAHSDIWSSRMREKYGLKNGEKTPFTAQN